MAGYFGAGLAGSLQGWNQGEAQRIPRVFQAAELQGELQKQALQRAQLQAQAEAQSALPLLLGGDQNYFGTPSPGQPSVPMDQPPVSSLPGIAAGQVSNPANASSGVGPMGIMPYRSMQDIAAQAKAPQQSFSQSQTPQGDAQDPYAKIAAMNISPMAKQILLKQMQPIIAQRETNSLRRANLDATLSYHRDMLEQRKSEAEWREKNAITPEERAQAREDRKALALELAGMRQQMSQANAASLSHLNPVSRLQEQMLKPIEEAQVQSQEIRGLLSSDNPAAAAQVQKLLTLYLQRTRFTNLNYGDQRSFGDVYQRFANAVSRWYAGDFTDTNKKMILDMLDTMDSKLMVPGRKNVENIIYKRLRAAKVPEDTARAWSDRPATFSEGPDVSATQDIMSKADAILSGSK